jgi:D-aminoacyl-tRNA deacylase
MRALIQRVKRARVTVDGETTGAIDKGMLVLLGAGEGDDGSALDYVLDKTIHLRIFADDAGKMNLSLLDTGGAMLVVSQFTLYGDTRRGRRPSFTKAMAPAQAEAMYEQFVARARAHGIHVETGRFAAMMDVELINDGPVTLMIDSADRG